METKYKYKLQGDGRDSWEIKEYEGDVLVNAYMVYEDPTKPIKTDISNIDINSLTDEQIQKLKARFGL